MSYTALYRKYRPTNFKNVVGQDVIVDVLKNSIINNHVTHAYLFTGPRGTGKTSIAKIFAHAVNCQNFTDDVCGNCTVCKELQVNDTDIIEIDAASNNGVDEIRTLRDNVKLLPNFCKYKIYIIDEVHMLSTGAFNALLKTLEEPPEHVIFILATTEPNKIPLTILSRCQRFDFNKIDLESLVKRLNFILSNENVNLPDDVIKYIAKLSDGGLRDAINLLDQVISLDKENITIEDIDKLSGNVSISTIFRLFDYLCDKKYDLLLDYVSELSLNGRNYLDIVNSMLLFIRNYSINIQINDYFDKSYSDNLNKYSISHDNLIAITKLLTELTYEMKNTTDQKLLFEIYLFQISNILDQSDEKEVSYSQIQNTDSEVINNLEIKTENNPQDIIENENKKEKKDDTTLKIEESGESSLKKLKDIRINNVFSEASKDILNSVIKDYDRINDYISSKLYNTFAALLIDGHVVAASKEYLLFAFPDESYIPVFDSNYKQIEIFLNEIYDISYKIVAVTFNEWENLKKEFIYNKKNNISYVKIDENDVKLEVRDNLNNLENSALDLFGEDSISVK